jgi:hypothetical protein
MNLPDWLKGRHIMNITTAVYIMAGETFDEGLRIEQFWDKWPEDMQQTIIQASLITGPLEDRVFLRGSDDDSTYHEKVYVDRFMDIRAPMPKNFKVPKPGGLHS